MLKMIKDRITVKTIEQKVSEVLIIENKTEGGFLKGEIISVGGDVKSLKAGQIVYHSFYDGMKIKHDGQDLIVLREQDICAVEESKSVK